MSNSNGIVGVITYVHGKGYSRTVTLHHESCGITKRAKRVVSVDKKVLDKKVAIMKGKRVAVLKCQSCHAKPPAVGTVRYNKWKVST
jgi:hypothetical protein